MALFYRGALRYQCGKIYGVLDLKMLPFKCLRISIDDERRKVVGF